MCVAFEAIDMLAERNLWKSHRLPSSATDPSAVKHLSARAPPAPGYGEQRAGLSQAYVQCGAQRPRALARGRPSENPVSAVKFLDEQNIRDRVLTPEEFQRMVGRSPDYLKPVLMCAY